MIAPCVWRRATTRQAHFLFAGRQRRKRRLSRRSLGEGGPARFARLLAARYDPAGQRNESTCIRSPCGAKRRQTPRQMNRFTYVYILQSEVDPEHFYIGRTTNLRARILRHNSGQVRHTSKWKPLRIKTYVALSDLRRALALERYLKSASGRAFVKKRL